MKTGNLKDSCDETRGERFFRNCPGVYGFEASGKHSVEAYEYWTDFAGNGTYWSCKWEYACDRSKAITRPKSDGGTKQQREQWIQPNDSIRVLSLICTGKRPCAMQLGMWVFDKWMPELEQNVEDAVQAMRAMKRSREKARDRSEKWIGIRGTCEKESPERDVDAIPDAVILQSARFEPSGVELVPSFESLGKQVAQAIRNQVVSGVKRLVGASGSKDTDAVVKKRRLKKLQLARTKQQAAARLRRQDH